MSNLVRTTEDIPYRYIDIYSAYRPLQSDQTVNNFVAALSQPLRNIKNFNLEYCSFANNICVFEHSLVRWTENDYPAPTGVAPITEFGWPNGIFYTPAEAAAYIQTNMNANSPNGFTYTVTVDSSGYFNWTSTGPFSFYGLNPNSGYFLGYTEVCDGRQIYGPSVPQFSTPLGTTFRPNWPCYNRPWGISIEVEGLTNELSTNATFTPSSQFFVPIASNYGELVVYYRNDTMHQNVYYFDKGKSARILKIKLGLMIPGYRNLAGPYDLHGDIFIRFSYQSFDDEIALQYRSEVI